MNFLPNLTLTSNDGRINQNEKNVFQMSVWYSVQLVCKSIPAYFLCWLACMELLTKALERQQGTQPVFALFALPGRGRKAAFLWSWSHIAQYNTKSVHSSHICFENRTCVENTWVNYVYYIRRKTRVVHEIGTNIIFDLLLCGKLWVQSQQGRQRPLPKTYYEHLRKNTIAHMSKI